MLFWLALLVEMVPELGGAEEDASSHLGEPVPGEAVLGNRVVLRATRRIRCVAEAGQRQPVSPVAVERVLADRRVLGAALQPVEEVIAEDVTGDRPISPGQSTQVHPGLVVVNEIPTEERNPRTRRAVVYVAAPVNEEARPRGPVHDSVIGELEPVEVVLVQMKEIGVADLHHAVDVVLIDGDVDPVVIEKYPAPGGEFSDAVVQDLKPVNGTAGRFDGAAVPT